MRITAIKSYSLLLSMFSLCHVIPATAVPVQAAEPVLHTGALPPTVNAPSFSDVPTLRVFNSIEGGFSILLPSSPTVETHILSASTEIIHLFHCRVKHESYIIEYMDKDPKGIRTLGPDKMLSILDEAVVKVNRGSVISSRHIVLGKYPGREIVTRRLSGNKETQRMYLVANRLYILTVTHPPTQTEALPTNLDKFLDSFTLLSAKLTDRK